MLMPLPHKRFVHHFLDWLFLFIAILAIGSEALGAPPQKTLIPESPLGQLAHSTVQETSQTVVARIKSLPLTQQPPKIAANAAHRVAVMAQNLFRVAAFAEDVELEAMRLIGQYGDDAEVIATLKAAELAAMGDADGLATWDGIIACIAALSGEAGGRGSPS